MKSFALFAAFCAVALSAEATKIANATTLDFEFSFSNQIGNVPGTVKGEVVGLSDNSGDQPASAVIIQSFPAALKPVCSPPCNMMASPWFVGLNRFAVSQLTKASFTSAMGMNNAVLILGPPGFDGIFSFSAQAVDGHLTFSPRH